MPRISPVQIIFIIFLGLLLLSGGDLSKLLRPAAIGGDMSEALVYVVAILLSITVHEANHAFVAVALGDQTPRQQGRLSLNPIRHLDPLGTLLILMAFFSHLPVIGWGKPVQFNPRNLRVNPLLGSAAVSLAGPLANVLFAMLVALFYRAFQSSASPLGTSFAQALLGLNIGLAAFNLLPIPPLDGFGVLQGILPARLAYALEPLRMYGPFILLAAVFLPPLIGLDVIGSVMRPLARLIQRLVLAV